MPNLDKKNSIDNFDEIDLKEIFSNLWTGKWIILSFISSFSIIGVIYSLSLPNLYESRALLVSTSPSNKSSIAQNYGSLASLAGINISEGSDTNAMQAIEKMKSLSFFENSILPNIFLPDLMAFESWSVIDNKSKYDSSSYDITNNTWVRKVTSPKEPRPSAQESFDIFMGHTSIAMDDVTNFLYINIKHQSPHIAKEWTELLVNEINSFYRKKDKTEAEKASNYLNNLLSKTSLSEIKEVIATLLEQEMQKLTLIEANEFYVYEFIDPPAIMEKKSEPNRGLICILAAIFGGLLGIVCILLWSSFSKTKND